MAPQIGREDRHLARRAELLDEGLPGRRVDTESMYQSDAAGAVAHERCLESHGASIPERRAERARAIDDPPPRGLLVRILRR
jgi:hypothetical protein